MTKEEFAALLNGREYLKEISISEIMAAKRSGLVVIFGASDDLIEIRGAVSDELTCYDEGEAFFTPAGLLQNDCDNDECPYFEAQKKNARKVTGIFDRDGYAWVYETDIPHATFDIMEDGQKYCRGIVFKL